MEMTVEDVMDAVGDVETAILRASADVINTSLFIAQFITRHKETIHRELSKRRQTQGFDQKKKALEDVADDFQRGVVDIQAKIEQCGAETDAYCRANALAASGMSLARNADGVVGAVQVIDNMMHYYHTVAREFADMIQVIVLGFDTSVPFKSVASQRSLEWLGSVEGLLRGTISAAEKTLVTSSKYQLAKVATKMVVAYTTGLTVPHEIQYVCALVKLMNVARNMGTSVLIRCFDRLIKTDDGRLAEIALELQRYPQLNVTFQGLFEREQMLDLVAKTMFEQSSRHLKEAFRSPSTVKNLLGVLSQVDAIMDSRIMSAVSVACRVTGYAATSGFGDFRMLWTRDNTTKVPDTVPEPRADAMASQLQDLLKEEQALEERSTKRMITLAATTFVLAAVNPVAFVFGGGAIIQAFSDIDNAQLKLREARAKLTDTDLSPMTQEHLGGLTRVDGDAMQATQANFMQPALDAWQTNAQQSNVELLNMLAATTETESPPQTVNALATFFDGFQTRPTIHAERMDSFVQATSAILSFTNTTIEKLFTVSIGTSRRPTEMLTNVTMAAAVLTSRGVPDDITRPFVDKAYNTYCLAAAPNASVAELTICKEMGSIARDGAANVILNATTTTDTDDAFSIRATLPNWYDASTDMLREVLKDFVFQYIAVMGVQGMFSEQALSAEMRVRDVDADAAAAMGRQWEQRGVLWPREQEYFDAKESPNVFAAATTTTRRRRHRRSMSDADMRYHNDDDDDEYFSATEEDKEPVTEEDEEPVTEEDEEPMTPPPPAPPLPTGDDGPKEPWLTSPPWKPPLPPLQRKRHHATDRRGYKRRRLTPREEPWQPKWQPPPLPRPTRPPPSPRPRPTRPSDDDDAVELRPTPRPRPTRPSDDDDDFDDDAEEWQPLPLPRPTRPPPSPRPRPTRPSDDDDVVELRPTPRPRPTRPSDDDDDFDDDAEEWQLPRPTRPPPSPRPRPTRPSDDDDAVELRPTPPRPTRPSDTVEWPTTPPPRPPRQRTPLPRRRRMTPRRPSRRTTPRRPSRPSRRTTPHRPLLQPLSSQRQCIAMTKQCNQCIRTALPTDYFCRQHKAIFQM